MPGCFWFWGTFGNVMKFIGKGLIATITLGIFISWKEAYAQFKIDQAADKLKEQEKCKKAEPVIEPTKQ